MMKPWRLLLGALAAGAALTACDSGRENPPNVRMVVVHAAPSYLAVQFLREQREEPSDSPLAYGGASSHSFDADRYEFNFDISPPGVEFAERTATINETLTANNVYYVILTEVSGEIEPVVVEEPAFDTSASDSRITIYNAGAELGSVDVYVEAPGADVTAETPLDAIGFRERIAASTFAAGEYQVTLTAPGAPTDVVFRSPPFETSAGQDNLLVITDDANQSTAQAALTRTADTFTRLHDQTASSALRAVNVANDRAARDVVLDADFAAPLFPGLGFGADVDHATIAPGGHDVTITPPDNPGVLELEASLSAQRGGYYTFVFGGPAGGLESLTFPEDRRAIADTARLRFVNAAYQFAALDVIVAEPGTDLAEAPADGQLQPGGSSDLVAVEPGDYELGLRVSETGAVVAGPLAVTLSERGIYTTVGVDGPDAMSAEILLLDDF